MKVMYTAQSRRFAVRYTVLLMESLANDFERELTNAKYTQLREFLDEFGYQWKASVLHESVQKKAGSICRWKGWLIESWP